MIEVTTFDFRADTLLKLKKFHYGTDWPAVYFLENGKEAYIGEAVNVLRRGKEHLKNPDRQRLKKIHILSDFEFNKSASLDIESWLIQYLSADNKFKLQNGNGGLKNHSYFDRPKYEAKFEQLWEDLRVAGLAQKTLLELRNSDLFKYSPYKALNEDQIEVVGVLMAEIKAKKISTHLVHGGAGTGKTILATYLMKQLIGDQHLDLKIALVVPMTSLRKTLRQVFRSIEGLNSNMILGPSDVFKADYDLLIVDEAHRLKKRRNISNYGSFDINNKKLGLDNNGTELDWIMRNSKHQIFFYDEHQSVKPSDIGPNKFKELDAIEHNLAQQMRVKGGDQYINFIHSLFSSHPTLYKNHEDYDVRFCEKLEPMIGLIKEKEKEHSLARMVAGYAWDWASKKDPNAHDIELDGLKLKWNSCIEGWVNSKNAINEIGCIHTVQGYDLNYVGVIIGPELSYDFETKEFIFKRKLYKDKNGHVGVRDEEELKKYIINIYKTLLTRGIRGTYVYVVDKNLREYLRDYFS
ncbi:DUF2075 domain-containing protein [bacterium]|nr:DUF2075 domain-containing protein [bacterium]NCQ54915.1 DUF2075 domain-containing protein [Candidatus Parcubacteria bacterium]NCS66959.1 DUF2075 domain-containing protein [Candidatus Peregrinibacteria bacterium]NCS95905.1 DUF2075 domain-containing protein [bacterium]